MTFSRKQNHLHFANKTRDSATRKQLRNFTLIFFSIKKQYMFITENKKKSMKEKIKRLYDSASWW